jgi:hypothetical protein
MVLAAPMGSLYWGNGKTIEARIGPSVYPIHYFQPVARMSPFVMQKKESWRNLSRMGCEFISRARNGLFL